MTKKGSKNIYKARVWSENEDRLLKEKYRLLSIEEMLKLLPERTKRSVRQRACKLKITKDDWSEEEVLFLKEHYLTKSYVWIGEQLNRPKSGVQQKAKQLGLKKVKNANWSKEEIDFLKENFNSMMYDDIQKHLKRSMSSIYNKVWELGLSSKDDKYKKLKYNQRLYILNNCHKMTDQQLADMFGVSSDAIRDLRIKNGIKKTPNSPSNKKTYPEQLVNDYLEELGVEFVYNEQLGPYYPDFKLSKSVVIEVQGDYFHCNPKLYPEGPNASQIEYIVKDYYKKCFYESNQITVLYIWEDEILNDWHNVKEKINSHCRLVGKLIRERESKIGEL